MGIPAEILAHGLLNSLPHYICRREYSSFNVFKKLFLVCYSLLAGLLPVHSAALLAQKKKKGRRRRKKMTGSELQEEDSPTQEKTKKKPADSLTHEEHLKRSDVTSFF